MWQTTRTANLHSNRWTILITQQRSNIIRKGHRCRLASSTQSARIQITKPILFQTSTCQPTLCKIIAILTASPIPLLSRVAPISDSPRHHHHLGTKSQLDITIRRQKEVCQKLRKEGRRIMPRCTPPWSARQLSPNRLVEILSSKASRAFCKTTLWVLLPIVLHHSSRVAVVSQLFTPLLVTFYLSSTS